MSSIYLDLNRINSKDKGNPQTNTFNIDLKTTLDLPAGTSIALQNTFINQKGVDGASIEIEVDYEERIMCNLYTTEDLHLVPDQTPLHDSAMPNLYLPSLHFFNNGDLCTAPFPQEYLDNIFKQAGLAYMGGSGCPMILYDVILENGVYYLTPTIVERKFTIKKGIYGINQIANVMTQQINGFMSVDKDNNYFQTSPMNDSLKERIYTGNLLQSGIIGGTGTEIGGLTRSLNIDNNGVIPYKFIPDATVGGNFTKVFISLKYHALQVKAFGTQKIKLVYGDYITEGRGFAFYVDNQRAKYADTIESDEEYFNVQNYNLGRIGYIIGAPDFKISYDSVSNGFSLNNLHQPFRPPTHDVMSNPIANAGTECISIKNLARNPDQFDVAHQGGDPNVRAKTYSTLLRPITRIGGASIHNFSQLTAQRLGDVDVDTGSNATFPMYFSTEVKAKQAWKTTIWNKLGFTYEQLNSPEHMELHTEYNNPASRLPGITTDANYDGSLLVSISAQFNPNETAPTFGGSKSVPTRGMQVFNEIDIATPFNLRADQYPNVKESLYSSDMSMYTGSLFHGGATQIHVSTTSRSIIARNLPTLSIYGYYIITGDIVSSQDDIVKEGDNLPILGIVPKSSLSNQDFFAVNNEIEHILTVDKKVGSIKIQILNPDLTPPELEENSSVVIRITKPPPMIPK